MKRASRDREVRMGALLPRYSLLLNRHGDARFTKCPRCEARTRVRKLALVVHVEHPRCSGALRAGPERRLRSRRTGKAGYQTQPAAAFFRQPGPTCGRGRSTTNFHVLPPIARWRDRHGQVGRGRSATFAAICLWRGRTGSLLRLRALDGRMWRAGHRRAYEAAEAF